MLNDNEKLGIRDLLSRLDEEIVYSLASTATKKALVLTSISEAVDAIILHSESAMWLLNRKKLTRALLFQYVNARQVPISGQADKLMISDMIIKLWNGTANVSSVAGSNNAATIECREVTEPARESDAMGMKFAQWFYGIILNVSNGTPGPSVADQFWRDARLSITVNHSGNSDRKETFGSNEVENLLKELLIQHSFILNPNLTDGGVKEKQNQYGLVIIAVCGTLYLNGNCSGIFEQAFGMVRDPSVEFRWRIKWSDLRITEATVNKVPCVTDLPELLSICEN